jgi:EAL domain-containing protein (putative c-di-GMP-specific phosphodiesterase class I)
LPGDFVALAEKNGMIIPIGEWMLNKACKQYVDWRIHHLIPNDLVFSVNLSPIHIVRKNFVRELLAILEMTGMPPQCLELGLSETAVMTGGLNLDPILDELKNIGINIAIGDFGIGYSSLSRLKTLPVSTLKISKSFIENLSKNADDATIVKSIIALGNNLGIKVTTEGVETQEQLDFLIKYHCSVAQGFYFEKEPLDADEMSYLLMKGFGV